MGLCASADDLKEKPSGGKPKLTHTKYEISDKKIENIDP